MHFTQTNQSINLSVSMRGEVRTACVYQITIDETGQIISHYLSQDHTQYKVRARGTLSRFFISMKVTAIKHWLN
jgi:hypothetical protein